LHILVLLSCLTDLLLSFVCLSGVALTTANSILRICCVCCMS
jgi:hypothetical protein